MNKPLPKLTWKPASSTWVLHPVPPVDVDKQPCSHCQWQNLATYLLSPCHRLAIQTRGVNQSREGHTLTAREWKPKISRIGINLEVAGLRLTGNKVNLKSEWVFWRLNPGCYVCLLPVVTARQFEPRFGERISAQRKGGTGPRLQKSLKYKQPTPIKLCKSGNRVMHYLNVFHARLNRFSVIKFGHSSA